MKKGLMLFATLIFMIGGQLQATKLKTLSLKNLNKQSSIIVSYGTNSGELRSFAVCIAPGETMKIKGWDVDRPTNIFVYDVRAGDHSIMRSGQRLTGFKGDIYVMPLGKTIDVKYSTEKGLYSNSFFLKDKNIITKCAANTETKFKIVPATECTHRFAVELKMDSDAHYSYTNKEYQVKVVF